MSISTATRKAGPFAGNGVQTVFPYAFKIFQTSDLVVTRADAAGVETILTLGADYTATMNADQDNAPGGNVTTTAALPNSYTLAITSNVPALQQVEVTNAGGFFPDVLNGVFDRLTILVQQVLERLGRQFTVPVTASGVTNYNVPVVPGAVLTWAADGSQLLALSLPNLAAYLALPSQAGNAGKVLTTNGLGTLSWTSVLSAARLISAGGLATGGGDLTADRTITVPAAAAADVATGTDTAKATTSGVLYSAAAPVACHTTTGTITLDLSAGSNVDVDALTGNITLANPSGGMTPGRSGRIRFQQDGTGGRSIAYGSRWTSVSGAVETLSQSAGKTSYLYYYVRSATEIEYSMVRTA